MIKARKCVSCLFYIETFISTSIQLRFIENICVTRSPTYIFQLAKYNFANISKYAQQVIVSSRFGYVTIIKFDLDTGVYAAKITRDLFSLVASPRVFPEGKFQPGYNRERMLAPTIKLIFRESVSEAHSILSEWPCFTVRSKDRGVASCPRGESAPPLNANKLAALLSRIMPGAYVRSIFSVNRLHALISL